MYNAKIIILSGPSGVGKGTIEKNLFKDESLKIKFSVSATTRKSRVGEKDGIHYFFKTKEEFLDLIKQEKLLEWNMHLNYYYGTLKEEIDKNLKKGNNVLVEVETNGALNIIKYYKKRNTLKQLIPIFIMPPNFEELKKRIIKRGSENEKDIQKRLTKAKEELKVKNQFKYIVLNNSLEICIKEIKNIIKKEINEI